MQIYEEWWFKVIVYFGSAILYISKYKYGSERTIQCIIRKCLPLFFAIVLHLIDVKFKVFIPPSTYSQNILIGLVFGMIGDGFLAASNEETDIYFKLGYISFCFGHISYIKAFGFYPLNIEALGLYILLLIIFMHRLFQIHTDNIFRIALIIYGSLVTIMAWRACAKSTVLVNKNFDHSQLTLMIGGILFLFSDYLLATKTYCPLPDCTVWLLATYYTGQFAIWTSAMDWRTFRVLN